MRPWAIASGLVLAATVAAIAIISSWPDWLPFTCSGDGDAIGCSPVVSPLLVGFVGLIVSLGLLVVGSMRSDP